MNTYYCKIIDYMYNKLHLQIFLPVVVPKPNPVLPTVGPALKLPPKLAAVAAGFVVPNPNVDDPVESPVPNPVVVPSPVPVPNPKDWVPSPSPVLWVPKPVPNPPVPSPVVPNPPVVPRPPSPPAPRELVPNPPVERADVPPKAAVNGPVNPAAWIPK